MSLAAFKELGADLEDALDHVNVPSYVIDSAGVIRWANRAAHELAGAVEGRQFTSVVAPEDKHRARELFARKLLGTSEVVDTAMTIVDENGAPVTVEASSVPLRRGDHIVGVFGQISRVLEEPEIHPELHLTPRQSEVLRLLERGESTTQIAADLHLSKETVRNHIRGILRAVGASSRLEAIAIARGTA